MSNASSEQDQTEANLEKVAKTFNRLAECDRNVSIGYVGLKGHLSYFPAVANS